jgi:hypothetical protein
MAWQTPKTDWQAGDVPVKDDFNRIEGNVGELDTKKANQADLASHTDASAPHSGHATTSALSGHTGATTAHAATSAATASRIMMRDAYGRAKVAAPSAADDIARLDSITKTQAGLGNVTNDKQATKAEFDAKMHATTGHKHTGATGDGPILKEISWIKLSDNVLFERLVERTNPKIENYVVLRPGKYRLTWEWRSSSGTESMRVRVRLEGHDYLSPAGLFNRSASTSSTSYVSGTMDVDVVIPAGAVIAIDWYEQSQRRNLRIKGTPQSTGAEHVFAIT